MKLRQYLIEGTLTAMGSYETDDFPPSTVIFGEKMVPDEISTLHGKMRRFISDPTFKWSDMKSSTGMENPNHHHKSIFSLQKLTKRNFMSHMLAKEGPSGDLLPTMEPDGPAETILPQQKSKDGFAAAKPEFAEWRGIKREFEPAMIGQDKHPFIDIDKVMSKHLHEATAGPKNLYTYKGKPFWSGAYDPLDGFIMEVHTYEEAEEADFHHTFYFSDRVGEGINRDKYAFFWLDSKGLQTQWRNAEAPPKIKRAIMDQIKKR